MNLSVCVCSSRIYEFHCPPLCVHKFFDKIYVDYKLFFGAWRGGGIGKVFFHIFVLTNLEPFFHFKVEQINFLSLSLEQWTHYFLLYLATTLWEIVFTQHISRLSIWCCQLLVVVIITYFEGSEDTQKRVVVVYFCSIHLWFSQAWT